MNSEPLKFCVAPDKFKGSLTAVQAAAAISAGILDVIPDARIAIHPLADGGEGTQDAFLATAPSQTESCRSVDPLRRPIKTNFVRLTDESVAVLEIAESAGLQRLHAGERNPMLTTTLGAGMVLAHALDSGAETILIGLGGSSTNDAGCGVALAFGWRFLDGDGEEVFPIPKNFLKIQNIVPTPAMPTTRIIALADVRNPLLGQRGCCRIYAPQKGATAAQIDELETALEHLANVIATSLRKDFRNVPGAGAAGGVGYGLMTFFGATIQPGFETIARYTHLEEVVSRSDWVVTGEGRLDGQSLEGKGPVALGRMAKKAGSKVAAFAGTVEIGCDFSEVFDQIFPLADGQITTEDAMADAANLLRSDARTFARPIRK